MYNLCLLVLMHSSYHCIKSKGWISNLKNEYLIKLWCLLWDIYLGSNRGEPRGSAVIRGGSHQKVLPIEIPALSLDELNKITSNFGTKALIGEGSYGRVFCGKLSNGTTAAIKKLDTSSSEEPDSDFTAQVHSKKMFSSCNKKCLNLLYQFNHYKFASCSCPWCPDLKMIILQS